MTKQQFLKTIIELNNKSVNVFSDLVNQIDEPQPIVSTCDITREQVDTIVYEIIKNLSALGTDILSSYDLSLSYSNQVELEDIEIDADEIGDIIRNVITSELEVNEED